MPEKKSLVDSQFLEDAYDLKNPQDLIGFYRQWASDYDRNMLALNYLSPQKIAALLAEHLTVGNPAILDIGCGTGLTGLHVNRQIASEIDGIDISGEMIAVARHREIYRDLVVGDLNKPLLFENDSYDAAISSGTFTHGHVGPEPLPEIARILKPGGLFACTVHFDLWHSRGFDAAFAGLISSGRLQCLALEEGSYFVDAPAEGWFCVYQKPMA